MAIRQVYQRKRSPIAVSYVDAIGYAMRNLHALAGATKIPAKKPAARESYARRNSHLRQMPAPEKARISLFAPSPDIIQSRSWTCRNL